MFKAALFLYIGWYLGKTGMVTDQSIDQLKAINQKIIDELKAQGVIQ